MVNIFLELGTAQRKRGSGTQACLTLGAGLEPAWLTAGERLGPGCTVHIDQCAGEGELGVVGGVDTTQICQPWHLQKT